MAGAAERYHVRKAGVRGERKSKQKQKKHVTDYRETRTRVWACVRRLRVWCAYSGRIETNSTGPEEPLVDCDVIPSVLSDGQTHNNRPGGVTVRVRRRGGPENRAPQNRQLRVRRTIRKRRDACTRTAPTWTDFRFSRTQHDYDGGERQTPSSQCVLAHDTRTSRQRVHWLFLFDRFRFGNVARRHDCDVAITDRRRAPQNSYFAGRRSGGVPAPEKCPFSSPEPRTTVKPVVLTSSAGNPVFGRSNFEFGSRRYRNTFTNDKMAAVSPSTCAISAVARHKVITDKR